MLVDQGLLAPLTGGVIEAVVALVMGFEGNNLRRWVKARRGWREVGTVSGRRLADAERAFFSEIEVTSTGALLPRGGAAALPRQSSTTAQAICVLPPRHSSAPRAIVTVARSW